MQDLDSPLVSIIITTYNHAQYIGKAIESSFKQTYVNLEVIVVDDGSTDNTKEILKNYPNINYHYQDNGGLSSARNTGIRLAKGKYVLFLDADDWLYPKAIEINLQHHLKNDNLGFVSGNHFKVYTGENYILNHDTVVEGDHYLHFLKGNYIGMHATVMYNKDVLKQYSFDQSLRTCEDYDIYLKIAKSHPVLHHTEIIAAYRLHTFNMSANYLQMLKDALLVLNRQLDDLTTDEELKNYRQGCKRWKEFYTKSLYWQKLRKGKKATMDEVKFLFKNNTHLFFRYMYNFILRR